MGYIYPPRVTPSWAFAWQAMPPIPNDLARTRWQDWLVSVEEALAILRAVCDRVVLIGQSMGGMVALLSAARYSIDGVVVISTPYAREDDFRLRTVRLWSSFIPVIHKGKMPLTDLKSDRREKEYPAYPFFPTRILAEVEDLKMRNARCCGGNQGAGAGYPIKK